MKSLKRYLQDWLGITALAEHNARLDLWLRTGEYDQPAVSEEEPEIVKGYDVT